MIAAQGEGDGIAEVHRVEPQLLRALKGRIGEKFLHEGQHLRARFENVLHQPAALVVRQPVRPVLEQLRAHLHAAEVIFQIMRQDPEQLILVLGERLELIPGGLQRQMRAHPGEQFRAAEGLDHIVHPAAFQRLHDERFVIRRREKDDGDVGPFRLFPDQQAGLDAI